MKEIILRTVISAGVIFLAWFYIDSLLLLRRAKKEIARIRKEHNENVRREQQAKIDALTNHTS